MARKTATITIDAPGRDHGRVFSLTEMPARQAEEWAFRALMAAARAGLDIPEDMASGGMSVLASVALRGLMGMPWTDAAPLLAEMMGCVRIVPDPSKPNVVRPVDDEDIEEVATRLKLRMEVWTLHTGFSMPAAPSTSPSLETAAPVTTP